MCRFSNNGVDISVIMHVNIISDGALATQVDYSVDFVIPEYFGFGTKGV